MYLHDKKSRPSSTRDPCAVEVNSQICVKDLDSGELFTFSLVSPEDLDSRNGKISILTSLGDALIGKCVGNVITWHAPSGLRRFEVQSVS